MPQAKQPAMASAMSSPSLSTARSATRLASFNPNPRSEPVKPSPAPTGWRRETISAGRSWDQGRGVDRRLEGLTLSVVTSGTYSG